MKCKSRKLINANNSCSSIMKLICLFALVIAINALKTQKQAASKKDYDFKAEKEAVIAELDQRFDGYREHCYPLPGDGCRCQETENGAKVSKEYKSDLECKTDEKRQRLCEDKQCNKEFKSINRCQTKEKCGQDKWAPYESCLKECMKIRPLPSNK
ncbi:hypothetical protein T4B_3 [Trichinella pseudospiralis]|uniref:Uncharacterized protein n=2 Tax=Trichinella pseudospiralis TaxID=6337 RepID=A0A0V1H1P3_TRIPS|nr:hypothetical protein T4B_3 [Trichinella pseudospiralis]KRZ35585.1 hypothetical protein T4C_10719 [Trichinella pseudospiralis]